MISTGVIILVLVVSIVILVGNTMIAIAFLRGRENNYKNQKQHKDQELDELHRRVEELNKKKD